MSRFRAVALLLGVIVACAAVLFVQSHWWVSEHPCELRPGFPPHSCDPVGPVSPSPVRL